MRRTVYFLSLLLFSLSGMAQVRPEGYIGLLPAIPSDVCGMNKTQQNEYLAKVADLSQQVKEELKRRDDNINANVKSKEDAAMQYAANQQGISQSDLEKIKSGKMSQAEMLALAGKIAPQRMASARQPNPGKLQKDKSQYELIMAQKHLNDSLNTIISEFHKVFEAIENDPERQKMLDNIDKLNTEIGQTMGLASNSGKELSDKLEKEKINYCNTFSPKYLSILRRYESFTKSSLSAYYRLEGILNQLSEIQSGIPYNTEPGGMGIGSVQGYLSELANIFRYVIN
jgi:Skp family chaperone for outer membrane proteins